MADPLNSESREALLQKLFVLMEKSDNIRGLPADRKERIKGKYLEAPLENIQRGIEMLEADIETKRAEQEKAKQSLINSIDKRKELAEQEKKEIKESEKLARQLLTQLGNISEKKAKKTWRWLFILVLVLLLAGLIHYFRIVRL